MDGIGSFDSLVVHGLDMRGGTRNNATDLVVNNRLVHFLVMAVMMLSVEVATARLLVVDDVVAVILSMGVMVVVVINAVSVVLFVMDGMVGAVGLVTGVAHVA